MTKLPRWPKASYPFKGMNYHKRYHIEPAVHLAGPVMLHPSEVRSLRDRLTRWLAAYDARRKK